MKRTDVLGNERSVTRVARPSVALPDSIQLTPIRLPRPHLDKDEYIQDIQEGRGPQWPRHYSSDDALTGRVLSPFPNHLTTRRMSSIELSDLTSPSQTAGRLRVRSTHGLQTVQTTTDVPATMPRVRLNNPRPSTGTGLRDGSPAVLVRPTLRTGQIVVPSQEEEEEPVSAAESIRLINEQALYQNPSISYQRFVFSLTKYPALILIVFSLCTLWGRGEGMPESNIEQGPDYAALATGIIILVSQVVLLHNHYNCYKKAKVMSVLYLLTMLAAFCAAATSIVLAAMSFGKLKQHENSERGPCKLAYIKNSAQMNNKYCLSTQDRITYLGVILGADAMIVVMTLATFAFGIFGQAMMKKKKDEEYQRVTRAKSYENEAMQF